MKKVLLVGNPNAGKTTLFNMLTSSNEHVGNWHGVTVEEKSKNLKIENDDFSLVDIPGIYSLTPLSFEEKVSTDAIFAQKHQKIINLCDKNNLQRNLYLTLCLLENEFDVLVVINNIDRKNLYKIDCKKLSLLLKTDVLEIDASKKEDGEKLKKLITKSKNCTKPAYFNADFFKKSEKEQSEIRYRFIDELLGVCTTKREGVYGKSKWDKLFLNKFLAFPVFFLILAGIFYLTFFSLGSFLSQLLSSGLQAVSAPILSWLKSLIGSFWLYDFFAVGIFGGMNIVLSFLPQVVLLFFFLSLLEDSGYMSRVAFLFEDILGKIGLSGRSVYTLLMGFGCSTSAIMTSRTMDDRNAKIKTALLCPYMSCSAKIPIYTVVGGAMFGAKNIFVILGLYFFGCAVAILVSLVLEKTILKSKEQSFILEFPPYRAVSFERILKILWKNIKEFLLKVGVLIVVMNIIVWILSSFSFSFSYVELGKGKSMLEKIGMLLSPIFYPLGFGNVALVCALLCGFVAKEIVVSTMAMFNGVSVGEKLTSSLLLATSTIFFATKASALSFLVFCLLYTPCISSVAMLKSEIGRKWTIFSIISQLLIAYILAFVAFNVAFAVEIFGFWVVAVVLFAFSLVVFSVFVVFKRISRRNLCPNCDKCSAKCDKRK